MRVIREHQQSSPNFKPLRWKVHARFKLGLGALVSSEGWLCSWCKSPAKHAMSAMFAGPDGPSTLCRPAGLGIVKGELRRFHRKKVGVADGANVAWMGYAPLGSEVQHLIFCRTPVLMRCLRQHFTNPWSGCRVCGSFGKTYVYWH